jgi:hypothetical protein
MAGTVVLLIATSIPVYHRLDIGGSCVSGAARGRNFIFVTEVYILEFYFLLRLAKFVTLDTENVLRASCSNSGDSSLALASISGGFNV